MKHMQATKQETGLIALLYSLIGQLTHLAPPTFVGNADFYHRHFKNLDGRFASVPAALTLLRALFELPRVSMICVVDSLESVEGQSTFKHLSELMSILRDQAVKGTRVLFTTNGMCRILAKHTKPREVVDATRIVQNRPGSRLYGGESMGSLDIRSRSKSPALQ